MVFKMGFGSGIALDQERANLLLKEKKSDCSDAIDRIEVVTVAPGLDFCFVHRATGAEGLPGVDRVRMFGDTDPAAAKSLAGFAIEEVSASGSVPFLRATNSTEFDVFLLAGQLVCGGKQNRGINADILVAAGKTAEIPVTCVEQGRWSGEPRSRFRASGLEPVHLRHMKMRQVHACIRSERQASADQSAVWEEVAHMRASMGASRGGSDLVEAYGMARSRRERGANGSARSRSSMDPARAQEAQRALDGVFDQIRSEALEGRQPSPQLLRQAARLSRLLAELRSTAQPNQVDGESLTRAGLAANGASGMLVFLGGEFLAGDLFADPRWFSRVYGDLCESALMTWESLPARRGTEESATPGAATSTLVDSVIRDALHGNWTERRPVAHGSSRLLEHPYLESAALHGTDGTPLHIVIGAKQAPTMLRNAARGGRGATRGEIDPFRI